MSMASPQSAAAPMTRTPDAERMWDRRFAPLVVHAVAIVAAGSAFWLSNDPVFILVTGGIIVIPTYLFLAWVEARRAPLWVSPLSFYFVWYALSLGVAAIYTASRIDNREIIGFSVTYVHPDDVAAAYAIYLVGSLFLHAGMQVLRPLRKRGEAPVQSYPSDVPVLGFGLLWLAGMAVRLFGSSLSFIGAAIGVLNWAPLAALCAYALVRGSARSPGLRFWVLLSIGMMVEFAFNLRTGSKAYIMYSFMPALWMMARERQYRKWIAPVLVGLLLFYFAILAPVVHSSRQMRWTAAENQADRIIRTYMDRSYDSDALEDQGRALLTRQFDPTPVAFLYREVERTGLRYGETLDYLAYAFIPRLIWPEKPSVTRGAWFTLYLGQARSEATVTTSTGQTATGELYWNFGVPGVMAGMGLIGVMLGGLWRIAGLRPHEDGLLFLLYLTICFGMVDMPEAGTVVVGIVYRVLVIGLLVWVSRYAEGLLLRRGIRSANRRVAAG
jgi:hypothetical protein